MPDTPPGVVRISPVAELDDLVGCLESTVREVVQRLSASARDRELQLKPIEVEAHRLLAAHLSSAEKASLAQYAPSEEEGRYL